MRSNYKNKIPLTEKKEQSSSEMEISLEDKKTEIIAKVKNKVRSDYAQLVQKFGEEHAFDILYKLLSDKYIKLFKRKEIMNVARQCVSKLADDTAKNRINDEIFNTGLSNSSPEKLKIRLEQLQSISDKMGTKGKNHVDELINKCNELLMEKQEQETIDKSDLMDIESEQVDQAVKESEKSHDDYKEIVEKITDDYSLLAQDFTTYYSKKGGRNTQKFKTTEQYFQFADLRSKVLVLMEKQGLSESEAINQILKNQKKNKNLSKEDIEILDERRSAIEKQKEENER